MSDYPIFVIRDQDDPYGGISPGDMYQVDGQTRVFTGDITNPWRPVSDTPTTPTTPTNPTTPTPNTPPDATPVPTTPPDDFPHTNPPYIVQGEESQQNVTSTMEGYVNNPVIPEQAVQRYDSLESGDIAGGSQFQTGENSFVTPNTNISTSTAGMETATTTEAQSASYNAATVGNAPTTNVAQGTVSREVVAATGVINNVMPNVQGSVTPQDLIDPATGAVSEDSLAEAATDTDYGAYKIGELGNARTYTMNTVTGNAAQGVVAQTDIDAAKRMLDIGDVEVNAAIANLPTEALVTSQLAGLLQEMEGGNTPKWAKPAIDQVEAMMAARGMSRSNVARDGLFNAIVQAAIPLAQSNATAIQARAQQNLANKQAANMLQAQLEQESGLTLSSQVATFLARNTELRQQMETTNMSAEQQTRLANLEYEWNTNRENMSNAQLTELENMRKNLQVEMANQQVRQNLGLSNLTNQQQSALYNAQVYANMDVANLSNEQQAALVNSQFYQTMSLTNLNNRQQAALTDITNLAAMDMQNATFSQQAQIENARNFLSMDMSNLNNEQQAFMLDQQSVMQTLLSDQAAMNASRQFNATNEQQTQLFNAQLSTQVSQFNASVYNAMEQFNAGQENAMEQFGSTMQFQRDQFNATMANVIEQSNVTWRRQMNQIDTAGQNAVNQANAIQAFNLSTMALSSLWQEMRDSASWAFQGDQGEEERQTRMAIAALSNESNRSMLEQDAWKAAGEFLSNIFTGGG